MACYSPIKGWRSKDVNPDTGKRSVVFNPNSGFKDMPVEIPCGQCIGCRLERSRQWAMRCVHEAQLHSDNCFITLTYDDAHLPEHAALRVQDFQKFMKRFRKLIAPHKIRFFHCGEYGENDPENPKHVIQYGLSKLGRPHYHALIFGYDFPDKELIKDQDGIKLYTSPLLSELWPFGFNTVGEVTFESAAYCARYVVKKRFGQDKESHYTRVNVQTGEQVEIPAEYVTMSRRPGIGKDWFDKYQSDVYPKDFTTIKGKRLKPPKYYDKLLEELDSELYNRIKADRRAIANDRSDDNTYDRLVQKEGVKIAQARMLVRPLDEEN